MTPAGPPEGRSAVHLMRTGLRPAFAHVFTFCAAAAAAAVTTPPRAPPHQQQQSEQTPTAAVSRAVTATCTNKTGDCTLELQAALDSGAATVRVPHIGRPWILSMAGNPNTARSVHDTRAHSRGYHGASISLRSNQEIILASGVELRAARGSFHGLQDSLIMGTSISNVTIRGEPPLGGVMTMWKLDYANQSLYQEGTCSARGACRMGFSLLNVSNLSISDMTVRSTGGDGLFVRGVYGGYFSNLILDNNFRQAVSITDGVDLLFEDCQFINTGQGAAASPACGVDMEPDYSTDSLKNITFRRCLAANNTGCGFSISPHDLLRSKPGMPATGSAAVDIAFESCVADGRGQLTGAQCKTQNGCGWTTRAGYAFSGFPPNITGTVRVTNCSGIGGKGPQLKLTAKSPASLATFTDCRFSNDGTGTSAHGEPGLPSPVITMASTSSSKFEKLYGAYPYGGVIFSNVTVTLTAEDPAYLKEGHHRAWLTVESQAGLENVQMATKLLAEPGSSGCSNAKVERAQAKPPFSGAVDFNFSCRNARLLTEMSAVSFDAGALHPAVRATLTGDTQTAVAVLADDAGLQPRGHVCPPEWHTVCPGLDCVPLSSPPPTKEVMAFHAGTFGGCDSNCSDATWKHLIDTDVITTIIAFTTTNLTHLACYAHSKGVRVVLGNGLVTRRFDYSQLHDAAYRTAWVQHGAKTAKDMYHFADGIDLDLEPRTNNTGALGDADKKAMANLTCEFATALRAHGSRLSTMDVAMWGSWGDFDVKALSMCAERIVPMAYCAPPSTTHACPTAPLDEMKRFIEHKKRLGSGIISTGVPADKLVLALPGFGYDFVCTNQRPSSQLGFPTNRTCLLKQPAVFPMVGFGEVMQLFSTEHVTSGPEILYDATMAAAWFEYEGPNNTRHQVIFDDHRSIRDKSAWAFNQLGVSGISLWTGDALYGPTGADSQTIKKLWKAAKPNSATNQIANHLKSDDDLNVTDPVAEQRQGHSEMNVRSSFSRGKRGHPGPPQ